MDRTGQDNGETEEDRYNGRETKEIGNRHHTLDQTNQNVLGKKLEAAFKG